MKIENKDFILSCKRCPYYCKCPVTSTNQAQCPLTDILQIRENQFLIAPLPLIPDDMKIYALETRLNVNLPSGFWN